METSSPKTPKNKKDNADREKMEQRVKNLFTQQDPPSYASNREVDAMKSRIKELEEQLALQSSRPDRREGGEEAQVAEASALGQESSKSAVPASVTTKPEIQPSEIAFTRSPSIALPWDQRFIKFVQSISNQNGQGQIGLWIASAFAVFSLMLLGGAISNLFVVHGGRIVAIDNLLVPASALMLGFNILGFHHIRHNRFALGGWILLLVNIVVYPVVAILLVQGLYIVASAQIIVFTVLCVYLVLPSTSRFKALITTCGTILVIVAIEIWNPVFRVSSTYLANTSAFSLAVITALIALAFIVRQVVTGSINTKLVTAFVGMAVLSMGTIAFQSNLTLLNDLTADIVNNQIFLARSQGLQIGQAINDQYNKLKSLSTLKTFQVDTEAANLDETRPRDVTQIEQLNLAWRDAVKSQNTSDPLVIKVLYNPLATQLRRFQETFPENVEIVLTDDKGFSIAATDLSGNYYQADALWWRTAHTTGQYIGQPIFDPASNSVALDMAIPVYSYTSGDFVGVMRTTVNFNVLSNLLLEGLHGETGYSIIYQPTGQQIRLQATDDGTYKIVQEFAPDILQGFLESSNESQEISLNGVPVLVSASPVRSVSSALPDSLGLQMVVVQEKADALQPVRIQTRNNLVLSLFIIVIVVAISYFLTSFITKPIIRLTAVAGQLASGDLNVKAKVETNDEIGTLAATFNRMTSQLRETLAGLEERVTNRTRDLELANEVGKMVSSKVNDLNELLSEAVENIRSNFNLYYTQVYITDPSGQTITLRAGTGKVGRELLDRGHHLLINTSSLNGRAAFEKHTVLVSDAKSNPSFLPNSLLPNTCSEMAIPLIVGDHVVGVLDMQSEEVNALNNENQAALEAVAGQLAVAIQNANLFEQARLARLEVEEQSRILTASGWREFLNAIDRNETIGYAFGQNTVLPISEIQNDVSENALVIPISVSGESIGEVQLADEATRKWTDAETEIIQTVVSRVAQHLETLRLLAQAEKYRAEAEDAVRRLTREGWGEYFRTRKEIADGFQYNQDMVLPLNGNGHQAVSDTAIAHPLTIRDEPIGVMMVASDNTSDTHATELIAAVAEQLSDHIESLRLLEEAEKRRLELETVATVSSTVSTVLDPDKLLQAVVDMTKERFSLYHAHIYLIDDDVQMLNLAAGAGDTGRRMVAQQHAIPVETEHSLVARASRGRETIIVNDVRNNPNFLPNALLPDTRAEMAIPMLVGTNVLGVFDVQSDKVDNFSREDADIYTTLASQVAVALQNARLYVEQAATVTQLRELDRLKSAFLANMSHELRTPLNSILGFTDVMLEGLDGDLTDYMDNDLRLIQKNGRHLLHLINDVLDMAKIESGRMNLHPESFRIHELLEEVTSITAPLASEKNLSLFIDDESDRSLEVYADNTRLRQVMINLVNNSIKFTEKGKITISVKSVDGARIQIAVKDTGIGIPLDHLEAVFQEFTQVDTSTTRKVGGTGLGLPISRRLIEMHGGRLWAESTGVSGEGSTFIVELPLEAQVSDVIEKQEN